MVNRPIASIGIALLTIAAAGSSAGQAPKPDGIPADRIIALDPRWTVSFDTAPSAPAGFDEEQAYLPLKGGELVAIELNQGRLVWKISLSTSLTPATGDGLVFAASDSAITALEQRSGESLWSVPIEHPLTAPLYWDTGWLLASASGGDLIAYRALDGEVLWRQPIGSPLAVSPTPAGDSLYVALQDGRLASLALDTGAIDWSVPLNESVTGLLALDDQLLVGTRTNRLHSLSLEHGRLRWTQRTGADTAGSPAADEKLIYIASLDNLLRAFDRRSGNLKWTRKLPSRPAAGPLRAGNVVLLPFVTTDIGAYTATTGADAFTIRAVGEIGGLPFLRGPNRPTSPRLIAMSREGALQGFAPRFEPPPAALGELPGVKVTGGS